MRLIILAGGNVVWESFVNFLDVRGGGGREGGSWFEGGVGVATRNNVRLDHILL